MVRTEMFEVTDEDVAAFRRDGAVMLKGVIGDHWLRELSEGIALNDGRPGKNRKDWVRDSRSGHFLTVDTVTVPHIPQYERYATRSPIGPIAARMMGAQEVLAFYLSIFLRSSGMQERTPWHQDQTYWCANGRQALSIWTSLDPVPAGTELEFVRGSHLWERPLAQPYFEQERLGGEMRIEGVDAMPVPDFSGADRDDYEIIGWPTEPGDIVIFHGMTVHGGSGCLPEGMRRRSVSVQWLGEDARVATRPGGCNPDWLPEFAEHGIGPGDYPSCAMCPTITAEGAVHVRAAAGA